MVDSLTAAQLRSYVDRLTPERARIEYCVARLAPLSERDLNAAPAFRRAGDLLGKNSDDVRRMVSMIKRHGGYDGAIAWLGDLASHSKTMRAGPLPADAVGFVYRARMVDYSDIIKIGFSAVPERRLKELQRASRFRLELEHIEVGTKLDEAIQHLELGTRRVGTEWFCDPAYPMRAVTPCLSASAFFAELRGERKPDLDPFVIDAWRQASAPAERALRMSRASR